MLRLLKTVRQRLARSTSVEDVSVRVAGRELPADLEAAIESCYVFPRSDPGDGTQRVVVQFSGRNEGWIHTVEASRQAIATRWPELSQRQLVRALRFLDGVVAMHLRTRRERCKRNNFINAWRDEGFNG